MKKLLVILALAAAAVTASAKETNDTTVCFQINPPMSCVNCENKIKNNLRFEKGVAEIQATAPGDKVNVRYNKTKTSATKIADAFSKIGYTAQPAGDQCTGDHKNCTGKETGKPCCGKKEGEKHENCSGHYKK